MQHPLRKGFAMSDDNLTPYERTYGAALGKQGLPAQPPAVPAPQPTTPAAPDPSTRVTADAPEPPTAAEPAPSSDSAPTTGSAASQAAPAPQPAAATPPPPPSQPTPPQPPAPDAPAPKQRIWPWVLLGCCVALVLAIGGCTACTVGVIAALDDYPDRSTYDDTWSDYLYDEDAQKGPIQYSMTYEEVKEAYNVEDGRAVGDALTEGAYKVSADGPLKPGIYYLHGMMDDVSDYYVFEPSTLRNGTTYEIVAGIEYLGSYFAEFEEGDVVVFSPCQSDLRMYPQPTGALDVSAPYLSGCYRVGIDIPAGTYTVKVQQGSLEAAEAVGSPAGAFVMDDLLFEPDSVVERAYVIPGGTQTVTVEDGQYLELFAAQADLRP